MTWLTEPFALPFMQRALLAGLLAGVTTATVGSWVVLRGLTFLGDALAHGMLPGIALAFVLAFDPLLGALLSVAVMIWGVGVVHRRAGLTEDVGIGLLFVGMLALGVVILSRSRAFAVSLTSTLFGDVLGVSTADLAVQAVAAAVSVAGTALLFRPFLVLAFNQEKAEILGLRPRLAHVALLALVAVAVVTSFRPVGVLLVFALLVAPPATASLLVRRVPTMIIVAAGLSSLAVTGGLLTSYHADTAASATVALVAVAGFFVVLAVREFSSGARAARRRRGILRPRPRQGEPGAPTGTR